MSGKRKVPFNTAGVGPQAFRCSLMLSELYFEAFWYITGYTHKNRWLNWGGGGVHLLQPAAWIHHCYWTTMLIVLNKYKKGIIWCCITCIIGIYYPIGWGGGGGGRGSWASHTQGRHIMAYYIICPKPAAAVLTRTTFVLHWCSNAIHNSAPPRTKSWQFACLRFPC